MKKQEGWSSDVTAVRAKTHYYKNGISLCGKAKTKHFMKNFDKERVGNKFFCDCGICIKKEREMLHEEPLCYKKS